MPFQPVVPIGQPNVNIPALLQYLQQNRQLEYAPKEQQAQNQQGWLQMLSKLGLDTGIEGIQEQQRNEYLAAQKKAAEEQEMEYWRQKLAEEEAALANRPYDLGPGQARFVDNKVVAEREATSHPGINVSMGTREDLYGEGKEVTPENVMDLKIRKAIIAAQEKAAKEVLSLQKKYADKEKETLKEIRERFGEHPFEKKEFTSLPGRVSPVRFFGYGKTSAVREILTPKFGDEPNWQMIQDDLVRQNLYEAGITKKTQKEDLTIKTTGPQISGKYELGTVIKLPNGHKFKITEFDPTGRPTGDLAD